MLALVLAVVALVSAHHHRHHRQPWQGPVTASWFFDAGPVACGFHARYAFASTFGPCGMRVQLRGPSGRVVTAVREDYGPAPYLHRTFDLNPATRDALGCGGLCQVHWRHAR